MSEANGPVLSLVERIDAALPQTQCTQCGFEGCLPYAKAIADDGCDINQCPPGGAAGIAKLALITGRPASALNPANGRERPLQLARIEEPYCIGCTLCIQACPVDAIVGANKLMHTILADQCTGCALCLPPCPVDCIVLEDAGFDWTPTHAEASRERMKTRTARLARESSQARGNALGGPDPLLDGSTASFAPSAKAAMIAAAVERARKLRQ